MCSCTCRLNLRPHPIEQDTTRVRSTGLSRRTRSGAKKTRAPVRKKHCRHQQQLYHRRCRRRHPHPHRRLRRLLLHCLHQDLRAYMMGRGILPDYRLTGNWWLTEPRCLARTSSPVTWAGAGARGPGRHGPGGANHRGLMGGKRPMVFFDFPIRSYKNVRVPSNNSQLSSVWPRSLCSAWL